MPTSSHEREPEVSGADPADGAELYFRGRFWALSGCGERAVERRIGWRLSVDWRGRCEEPRAFVVGED